ncbi:MAG: ParB/RepB/Spo0J family partition protein [Candidatus Poribacteria bacterium]|nr:ParB/RepB/Spo0J family partition protein [Candidatus Poribacteria bacterium]
MASTRYGRIYHGDHHHNNIKFASSAAREKFIEAFKKYHDSHDHDGEVPRFEIVKAADIKSYERGPKEAGRTTIDGYSQAEIKEYHNRDYPDTYTHYRPPTCCVSPMIVFDREFIDSGTLERHELSSVFGDIPDSEFESLMASVKEDGFMDPIIRIHEGQILDGWHRYRAALQLNLVRKLMFSNWNTEKEGEAIAFVYARNLERRHYTPSQRAQIAVSINERFGWGGDRSKGSNEPLKTQEELAKGAKVSKSSIKRAVQVEKAGESKAVIDGEKTSSEVLGIREKEKLRKQKKQLCKSMWDTRQEAVKIYMGDGDSDLNELSLPQLEKGFEKNNPAYAEAFVVAMKRTGFFSLENCIEKLLQTDVEIEVLQTEHRALQTYIGDLRNWERPDWSPDTNWILPLIEQKKKAASVEKAKPEPEDDVKTLWEKVTAAMPKWKQKYKETGYKESELVSRASKSQLINALRAYRESDENGAATVEELKDLLDLMKRTSYPFYRRVRKQLGGLQPSEPEETPEPSESGDQTPAETPQTCPDDEMDAEDPDEDTSLAELNLPSLKGLLDTLLDAVGPVSHSIGKEDFSCAVFDLLAEYESREFTEREQLSMLIDCALMLIVESESYPHA